MNDAQRATLAALRKDYEGRGVDVHGFDGEDDVVQVIVFGRITGAEIRVHRIAPDGRVSEDEATPEPRSRRSRR